MMISDRLLSLASSSQEMKYKDYGIIINLGKIHISIEDHKAIFTVNDKILNNRVQIDDDRVYYTEYLGCNRLKSIDLHGIKGEIMENGNVKNSMDYVREESKEGVVWFVADKYEGIVYVDRALKLHSVRSARVVPLPTGPVKNRGSRPSPVNTLSQSSLNLDSMAVYVPGRILVRYNDGINSYVSILGKGPSVISTVVIPSMIPDNAFLLDHPSDPRVSFIVLGSPPSLLAGIVLYRGAYLYHRRASHTHAIKRMHADSMDVHIPSKDILLYSLVNNKDTGKGKNTVQGIRIPILWNERKDNLE